MPEIGETKRSRELGYQNRGSHTWVVCPECGKERWAKIRRCRSNICRACACKHIGLKMHAEKNPRWKGGRRVTGDGYISIKLQPNDFFYSMMRQEGYVLEHRLIMAQHLKRCLLPWEVVHHKNGVRTDNRLGNLELIGCSSRHNTEVNKLLKEQGKQIEHLARLVRLLIWQNNQIMLIKTSDGQRVKIESEP